MRFSHQITLRSAALRLTTASIQNITANVAAGKPAKIRAAAQDEPTRHALAEYEAATVALAKSIGELRQTLYGRKSTRAKR